MYCKKCGKEVSGCGYCPSCGTKVGTDGTANVSTTQNSKKFHCPKCKSDNLSVVSVSGVKSIWMCHNCLARFKDAETIDQEIEEEQIVKKRWKKMGIISYVVLVFSCVLWFVFFLAKDNYNDFEKLFSKSYSALSHASTIALVLAIISLLATIVSKVLWNDCKNKIEKLYEEKKQIQASSYDL